MYETILYESAGGVTTITLNRPDVLNAMSAEMHRELQEALARAGADEATRCLVITGAGRAFCSGADLQASAGGERSLGDSLRKRYNPIIARLRGMEKPAIAAVNGVAAGAGCSLALACDLRLASDQASFLQAFVRIGLIPDSGATYFLPRLVGMGRAMEMAMLGDRIDAATAERIGLVNRVVPHAELPAATAELARRLAGGPTKALGLIKRALNRSPEADLDAMLELEAELQETAGGTADFAEGVAAFLERRPPRFQGR